MPGGLDRIRKTMKVTPTPRDKGLELDLRVVAYDNGMVEVDGVPVNDGPPFDQGEGWLGAVEIAVSTLNELRRQAETRKKSHAAGSGA